MNATDDQWSLLLTSVAADEEMLHGQFVKANGAIRVPKKWDTLAVQLNAVPGGSQKTGKKWMEVRVLCFMGYSKRCSFN